jgi:hypothetical protein
MSEKSTGDVAQPFLQHHDDEGFLDALQLLISSDRAKTPDALVRYAEQAKEPAAADYLRLLAADHLPVSLMFDALSVHIRIIAHKRNNHLLRACADKQVGLVLPLPPHVIEAFVAQPKVTVIVPDNHHLPAMLRKRQINECRGTRAGRNLAPSLDVLVFEVCRDGQNYLIDPTVSDVVDLRLVPKTTQLIAHVRPHSNPDDILLNLLSHHLDLL